MDHAGRIVERVVVDHETRMAGAGEHFDQLADGDALLHGDDVGPRHHDALDPALAQGEDVLEHRGFCGREAGFALFSGQHEFKIGAGRGRSPAEQDAHHAREPAIARLSGLRHDHGKASMLALAQFAAVGGLGHGSGQGLSVSGVGFRPWPGADRGRESPAAAGCRARPVPSPRHPRVARDRSPKGGENHGRPDGRHDAQRACVGGVPPARWCRRRERCRQGEAALHPRASSGTRARSSPCRRPARCG